MGSQAEPGLLEHREHLPHTGTSRTNSLSQESLDAMDVALNFEFNILKLHV